MLDFFQRTRESVFVLKTSFNKNEKILTKISQIFETHFIVFVTLPSQSEKKKQKQKQNKTKSRKIIATVVKTVEENFRGHLAKVKFFKTDSLHVNKNYGSTIAIFSMVLEIFLPEV